jgi:predicted metalloprotease
MDAPAIRQMFIFARAEEELISGFGFPPEAFIPLILSLRSGGDWSYADGRIRSVSVVEKTTRYDDRKKRGRTCEDIYLIINPELAEQEGKVKRLEKCGEEEIRLLVERPYRVRVKGEKIVHAVVDPEKMAIRVREIKKKELEFTGSSAYGMAHEMEHISGRPISGKGLYEFTYQRARKNPQQPFS